MRNIATLVSGDIRRPLPDADSIQIEGGRVTAVGKGLEAGPAERYVGMGSRSAGSPRSQASGLTG